MAANNYVLGKGKLYFQQFAPNSKAPPPGAGFLYFGNTPSAEYSRTSTVLDHYDADNGIKIKDDAVDIETNINGKFATDNVSAQNLAIFFGGAATINNQAAGSQPVETLLGVLPDSFYQIGQTATTPQGLRGTTAFSATMGSGTPTVLVAGTDYSFDPSTGLFYVIPGGAISSAGAQVNLTYTLAAATQSVVIEQGAGIYGSLKFVSTNPKGSQRDMLAPYVKITADGSFALKGDTWQTMSFNFEALKLNDLTRRLYITSR